MVKNRITDGKRIGQFLASELTGLETGVLAQVSVESAVPDAEPTATGTRAYEIAYTETVVGDVLLFPDAIEVCLYDERQWPAIEEKQNVSVDGDRLRVESAAAVKHAVDLLCDVLGA